MKNDNGLAIALFAIVMGGAVVLAIANDVTAPACAEAKRALSSKDFDFGCFEFWVNRYQSLIGNILTAGVAGATLLWLARQLVTSNRQAAAAATDPMYRRIAELTEERRVVRSTQIYVYRAMERLDNHFKSGILHGMIPLIQGEIAEDFRLIADAQDAIANAHSSDRLASFAQRRVNYFSKVGLVAGNLGTIQRCLRDVLRDPSLAGQRRNDVDGAIENIRQASEDLSICATDLSLGLRAELDRTWERARKLQRIAFGDDDN